MLLRHDHCLPFWRACGAAIGVFAVVVQVLLSGLPGGSAHADGLESLSVICSHDGATTTDRDGPARGLPASHEHHCPACACPHHHGLFGPPPRFGIALAVRTSRPLALAAPRSQSQAGAVPPYASRAPPRST